MKLGVVFPQTEIGSNPDEIRDFVQAVEGMGYDYLAIYEHVSGIRANKPGYEKRMFTHEDTFHDPLVLFGYLAGLTENIRFLTSILVLPSRQTLLVAKQTAQVDVLSGGRIDLGVAVGGNPLEYQAMGKQIETRGDRISEQIVLLRELWTKPYVQFTGKYHQLNEIGINPLPIQRPIPIWMGGIAEPVLRRAVDLCDGWLPPGLSPEKMRPLIARIDQYLRDIERDRSSFGIRCRVKFSKFPQMESVVSEWHHMGASHIEINTMNVGFENIQDHIMALEQFYRMTRDD